MPITLLDVILLVVMLISALLAMVRGFMREVLSIASWATAALVTVLAFPKLLPTVQGYLSNDIVAKAVTIGVIFLGTLIVVAVITIKISDMILDSRIGALDRTLGFLFGLARGLLIVVVAYAFFDWLVLEKSQPKWATEAKSLTVLRVSRDWLIAMSPDLEALWQKYKKKGIEADPQDTNPPAKRSSLGPPAGRVAVAAPNSQ
jgi:membrane protein required for colicin V production